MHFITSSVLKNITHCVYVILNIIETEISQKLLTSNNVNNEKILHGSKLFTTCAVARQYFVLIIIYQPTYKVTMNWYFCLQIFNCYYCYTLFIAVWLTEINDVKIYCKYIYDKKCADNS